MSKLENRLQDDIVAAMKDRDSMKLAVLRMLKSAVQLVNVEKRCEESITDEDFFVIVRRLIKQRREAADMYASNGANDRAESELEEIKILEAYQPQQMSDDELARIIEETALQLAISDPKDMGKLMGKVIASVKGQAEGNRVRVQVEAYMSSLK